MTRSGELPFRSPGLRCSGLVEALGRGRRVFAGVSVKGLDRAFEILAEFQRQIGGQAGAAGYAGDLDVLGAFGEAVDRQLSALLA